MGKANRRFHGADLFGIRIFRWAAALSGLILLAHCTGFAQSPARHPAGIQPAPAFNRLFDRSYGGWTGGDGTLSIPLPDGRSVWLFGDTFLGRVTDDGKRSMDTPLVRNCLVVQDGRSLKTLLGSDGGKKRAFFRPGGKVAWYWPGDGSIEEGRLAIFLHRFEQQYPGMWGWRWTGNALATVSLPDLTLEKIDPLVSENGVLYGVSV